MPPLIKISSFAEKFGWKSLPKKIFKELHEKFGGAVRLFIVGGAAPDPKIAKGLREFGFNFVQGYGLTETSPILTLNQIDNFKDDAAGIPLSGIEIKILGDTKPIRQWDVMGEFRRRIKKVFDREGVEIPWPHTKVYFGNTPFNNLNREERVPEDTSQNKAK